MNKKERVEAALRGDPVDRVPTSVWGHDYEREWSAQGLAEATVENFTRYDWDYVKVNPRSSYHVEGWKVRVRPSGEKNKGPICEDTPIKSTSDWKRLRQLEPDQGALGEQLKALQLINHSVGYDAYFVQTIFTPLGIAQFLAGGQAEPVLHTIREDRSAMHSALRVITETFTTFAIACLEYGASGIFYATNGWASQSLLTPDQYREFGEQYDLEFLDAIKRARLNILHNCGSQVYFDQLASYPVHALSWAANAEGNPSLLEGRKRSGKAVMGGLSHDSALKSGSPSQVRDEVAQVLEQTGGLGILLAPGCVISPATPAKNLEAVRFAASGK
ncbi:MAG TPA: uroporphyrinogen decarboxylase family protein [Ktedonobacteraceae bacterium]|nr:uroporphyrinogen decarboxylase family protein [Ktedonobacteraceae bacterium]